MKNFLLLLFCTISIAAYSQPFALIPQPASITSSEGDFNFNRKTYIVAHDIISFKEAVIFNHYMAGYFQFPVKTMKQTLTDTNYIEVSYDTIANIPSEGYILKIEPDKISIRAKNKGGVFYGLTTLFQLFAQQYFSTGDATSYNIPCCTITDYPRFQYRGMHLDCARHFFDVDFIKKYIDYLALYKYNTFHWHLTDDQGWRIEIKQYPKLTQVGAWRDGTMIGHYRDQKFDSIKYGGYYTQAEIKLIVKYAAERNITIVPEIEMPGHCLAALAAYPELGCVADTTYAVSKSWGVLPEAFCPTEETFTFLENVLNEVMELFPSQYLHIGGDEVEKTRWRNSSFCQSLMKEKGLADEHALQSYFIQRIEKYVNSKGKKIIGWDEILEGGVAPNATIMSWRGEEGGIAAAQQNHFAIMTPGSHCYFDYYQGSPANEPLAIGGYIPLEKVYSYEPIPAQLNAEQSKYILGAQANIWTEYINTPQQIEYMAMPRMLALSEVLWSRAEVKNYDYFIQKVLQQLKILDKVHCNYAKTIFKIDYKINPTENNEGVTYSLNSPKYFGEILVNSSDSSNPTFLQYRTYSTPVSVTKNTQVRAKHKNDPVDISFEILFNKATGKKIILSSPPAKKYSADGAFTLVNGIEATTNPNWSANEWLGFEGTDCDAIIDLGKTESISKITVGYLEDKLSWIWIPTSVTVELSTDGVNYSMPVEFYIQETDAKNKREYSVGVKNMRARYVKVHVKNYGVIPTGNPGSGYKAWLFVDEISIE